MAVKRIVQIDCPDPRGQRDISCGKCQLPLHHHGVRFEVLDFDGFYDVYALHPVQKEQPDPNLTVNTRLMVLHVSGRVLKKFRDAT